MTSEAPQDVAALRKLRETAEAATPGPWEAVQTTWRGKQRDHWAVRAPGQGVLPHFYLTRNKKIGEADLLPQDNRDAAYIAAASPDVVLGLLDQNDRLRLALREIVDAEDRLNAAWQDTSRGFFVEQVEDHDHARRNAIAAARELSQRGSGAEEAARNG